MWFNMGTVNFLGLALINGTRSSTTLEVTIAWSVVHFVGSNWTVGAIWDEEPWLIGQSLVDSAGSTLTEQVYTDTQSMPPTLMTIDWDHAFIVPSWSMPGTDIEDVGLAVWPNDENSVNFRVAPGADLGSPQNLRSWGCCW